jgi:predicted DsbA family dithiol-disulfide isomerase
MFKPIVERVSRELGINVNYIDAEQNTVATQNFGINSVPTIIVTDLTDNILYRKSGASSYEELYRALSNLK